MNYKVYKHIFPNGKLYIGITCRTLNERWRKDGSGYEHCPRMNNAIKKYGWENVKHEILFEGLTKEEAEQKERELIAQYKSNQREYGYNVDNGGRCIGRMSEETKKKISLAKMGSKPPSACFKKGSIPWNKGKHNIYSKEVLEKLSLARANRITVNGITKSGNAWSKELGRYKRFINRMVKREGMEYTIQYIKNNLQ